MISINVLKDVTPKSQRSMITEELVDKINEWNKDPKLLESYGDNVLSYIGVLKEGRFKISDYLSAVRFVSYKLMGFSDIDAYAITFPDRYDRLRDEGLSRDEISPYVSGYKKNQLVTKIFEQSVIPLNVTNNHMGQEALNELMNIGMHGRSELARVAALSKVVDKTDAPEIKKVQLDIGIESTDAIEELRKATQGYAQEQLQAIRKGSSVKSAAESVVIEVEVEDAQ